MYPYMYILSLLQDLDEESISSPIVYGSVHEKTCLGMLSWQLKHTPVILKMIIRGLSVVH